MTSKAALKRIRQETCPCSILPDFDKDECLEIIEKDLSALEILKNHIDVDELEHLLRGEPRYVYYINLLQKNLTKDEYDLLKERLKK